MTVELRCPACRRFLADVGDYGRVVCSGCGAEVTYRSREDRRRDRPGQERLTVDLPFARVETTTLRTVTS